MGKRTINRKKHNKVVKDKRILKKITIGVSVIVVILLGYSFIVEPNLLQVNKYICESSYFNGTQQEIKIVQFTDVHLGQYYNSKTLKKVVEQINALSPDIVVCTGDLIDLPSKFNQTKETIELLSKLEAPLGKYAVYGNHEYKGRGESIYRKIMKESDFQLLVNGSERIELEEGKSIRLFGTDDWIGGEASLELTLEEISNRDYNILLSHEPDIVRQIKDKPIQLQLSGHSHGGQVRLPFIGTMYTPKYAKTYIKGMYQFEENNMRLYVNVGVGTTLIKSRFLNLPEIAMFTIRGEKEYKTIK